MSSVCSKEKVLFGPAVWGCQKNSRGPPTISGTRARQSVRTLRERYIYFIVRVKLARVKVPLLEVKEGRKTHEGSETSVLSPAARVLFVRNPEL